MSEAQHTSPYPLDFADLKRGDTIPVDRLEEVTGLRRTNIGFRVACLTLRDEIQAQFRERGEGEVKIILRSHDGLVICKPLEQHMAVERGRRAAIRSFFRRVRENAGNDASLLPDEIKVRRDEAMARDAWISAQLRKRKPPAFPSAEPKQIGEESSN